MLSLVLVYPSNLLAAQAEDMNKRAPRSRRKNISLGKTIFFFKKKKKKGMPLFPNFHPKQWNLRHFTSLHKQMSLLGA